MGYALKIKDVDFSDVAVDQVTYIVPIPCTGIALNTDTITVERAEGTSQLTATLTPNDTTDHVTWTSSDENVATVSGTGLITVHGIGTATITATCGEQTATASITQTTIKAQYDFTKVDNAYPDPTGNDQSEVRSIRLSSTTNQYAFGQAYHSDNLDLHMTNSTDIECIRVPYGATKVYFDIAEGETDFTVSYLQIAETNVVTVSGVQCCSWLKYNTNVSAANGKAVEFGQCIALRILANQLDKVGNYAYFT